MASTEKTCSQCGALLQPNAAAELCRRCVLTLALTSQEEAYRPNLANILEQRRSMAEVRLHQFGDYELEDEIARGGMGVVFRGHQVSLARTVALKFILGQRLDSKEARRRFRQEAEAAARLDHPHIVPIYEHGEYEGHPFLCMKYIESGTLAEQLRGGGFHPPDCGKMPQPHLLLAKIARAVHYAHGRGVLHRDLKPSNILIDSEGDPYVSDFGLAKFADSNGDLTHSTAMLGTPRYMSPEQCRSDHANISTASDVFSLGVILYEMLAGRAPFQGDSTLEVIRKVNEEEPPALTLVGKQRDLATICMKCLEKEPSQRYGSALALAEDLERFERGEPILARPVGTLERALKWTRRKPALTSLAAATALALVSGTLISLWQGHEAQAARNDLAVNLYAADMALAHQAVDEGRLQSARELLLRHIPAPGRGDSRGWEWRWLWCQSEPQSETLFEDSREPILCVSISPNERWIAFGGSDGAIRLWDSDTGDTSVFFKSAHVVQEVTFSQDGQWLALTTFDILWETFQVHKETFVFAVTSEGPDPKPLHRFSTTVGSDEDGQNPRPIKLAIRYITKFVESLDGHTQLLVGVDVGTRSGLRLWAFQGEPAAQADTREFALNGDLFHISQDSRQIVTFEKEEDAPDRIHLYQTLTGEHQEVPLPWEGDIRKLALSPDGHHLAVLGKSEEQDRPVNIGRVVHLPDANVVGSFTDLIDTHDTLTFLDDERIATTSGVASLQIWEPSKDDSSILTQTYRRDGVSNRVLAVAPQSAWLVLGALDGKLQRLEIHEELMANPWFAVTERTRAFPGSAKVSYDATIVAGLTGNPDDKSECGVWDLRLQKHTHFVHGLPLWLSPEGKQIVCAHTETDKRLPFGIAGRNSAGVVITAIERWDLSTDPARSLAIHHHLEPPLPVTAGAAWADGSRVVFGSASGDLTVIDLTTGETISLPHLTDDTVAGLSISPDGRYLAFSGRTSGLYDLERQSLVQELTPTREGRSYGAFSQDGQFYAHPARSRIVEVYRLNDMAARPHILRSDASSVIKLAFTPDGKTLAAGSLGVVKLWNVATWRAMGEVPSTWDLEFSADGNCLITDGHYSSNGQLTIRRAPTLAEIGGNIR